MAKEKPPEAPERIEETSADLPYELQHRTFEQLATVSLGGAGLTITLAGSILDGSRLVWMATVYFAIAAVLALSGQQSLISKLFARQNTRKSSRITTLICSALIGMGIGSLGAAVSIETQETPPAIEAPTN